jgi:hypothetical protein
VGSPRRPRSTAAERAQWGRRYQQSGLSQREFARQQAIGLSTLQRWLRETPAPEPPPVFAEVAWPAVAPRWAVEVVRADGTVLRLTAEVPPAWLPHCLPPC